MDFFVYSISGFIIVKYFFSKNRIEKIILGLSCLIISVVIRYEAVKVFDWGMFFHVGGAFFILLLLDFLSKIRKS